MPLAKWSQEPKLSSSYLLIRDISIPILVIVQLQLIYFYYIYKQEGLYNKVNNIANIPNPLVICQLVPVYLLFYIGLDRMTEDIVQRGVISYNSSKLVYNTIVL